MRTRTLSLIGPFRVNHADPGIDGDGVSVAPIAPGTLVVKAWLVMVSPFMADGTDSGHQAYLTLGPGTGTLTNYAANFGGEGDGQEAGSDTPVTHRSQFAQTGAALTVSVYPGSGSFNSGACDAYALVMA